MQPIYIAAGLMLLWIAYCWFLFVRKRYEPLFVLPMACFSIFALWCLAIVLIYNDPLPNSAGQFVGIFIVMALITGAALKRSRAFVWLVIALTTYRILASVNGVIVHPSGAHVAMIALQIVAVLSLFYIVQFRPTVLDAPHPSVKSVFD